MLITQDVVDRICNAVFDEDTKNTLKITLANRTEITINKQFYYHFKNSYLKYELEETIAKAYNIFEHAKQDIIKYKLAKSKLEELNNPSSFFNANTTTSTGGSTNAAINVGNTTTNNKNTQLNYLRADATAISTANAIGRAGTSQMNEDYKNLEASWKKDDEKYDQIKNSESRNTFDIQLPTNLDEDINLNTVITQTQAVKLDKAPELLEQYESPEISYTGVNVNKSLSSGTNISSNTNKALNISVAKGTNESKAVNTAITTNKSNAFNLTFVYGDATYKALGLYISNFKESFLNSFSTLFFEPWTGY